MHRLLLLADDLSLRAILSATLWQSGYAVRQASLSDLPRATLATPPVDVALLDLDADVPAAPMVQKVHTSLGRQTPIVLLVDPSQPSLSPALQALGVRYLLGKPFERDALLGVLDGVLAAA
jgi:DNA-binding response OmpR family regulator